MKKSPADSTLDAAWRQAVMTAYNYRCGMCGLSWEQGALQCHHIVKRRRKFTRWSWKNGIPLCVMCHEKAHTKAGELFLMRRHPWYDELVTMEQVNYKDYLLTMEWTENEFRRHILNELKEKAGEVIEI